MDLQDKRVLITGGTSGMGIATAQAMAEKGATVLLTGRDKTRGASAVEEIRTGGHDAQFIAADFSELPEVRRVADAAGEIDVLVNCAGFAALAPTADTDEGAFDGLFQINVKAPFFLVAALVPKIAARGGGSIINVSTMVASYGQPGIAAHGASRAAIELLTKAWAAEYGPQNVRVNAVAPGPTLTPAVEPRSAMATEFAKQIPLGRLAARAVRRHHVPRDPGGRLHQRGDHPRRWRPPRGLRGEEMRALSSRSSRVRRYPSERLAPSRS